MAAGLYADVADAQRHMASAVERTHQPDPVRVAEYERLYQRYLAWGAAAEPLYNRGALA
ncbi:Ribulokinase [compost metagenome]